MREYLRDSKTPFHIYNRGTEKRTIFTDYSEYCRFVFLMWVCRVGSPEINLNRKNIVAAAEAILAGKAPNPKFYIKENKPLVSFITWNLLPNHFHFILVSLVEGGISKFMGKVANAYTKYFNARHQRSGRLFQGSFQSIAVEDEKYLFSLIKYINLNHAELVEPRWKDHKIRNKKKLDKFIDSYIWSANLDFIGERRSCLIDKEETSRLLDVSFDKGGMDGYGEFIKFWLKENFDVIERYILE